MRKITDVPGMPLYNYKQQRTYLAGGTKWPQYGPRPENNTKPKPFVNTTPSITIIDSNMSRRNDVVSQLNGWFYTPENSVVVPYVANNIQGKHIIVYMDYIFYKTIPHTNNNTYINGITNINELVNGDDYLITLQI